MKTPGAAISPLAMGKALLVFATSCTALGRIGKGRRLARGTAASLPPQLVASAWSSAGPRDGASYSSVTVTLRYRDGDEEQDGAEGGAIGSEARVARRGGGVGTSAPCISELQQLPMPMVPQLFTSLFTALPIIRLAPSLQLRSPPSPLSRPTHDAENQEQLVMDEYLEFIERRYSRLHPKPQHAAVDFHAIAWSVPQKLFLSNLAVFVAPHGGRLQEEPPAPQQDSAREDADEDPLNVLGLSGLASEKLRQRLHVPVAAVGGRTSSFVSLSFPAQLRLLSSALQRMAFMIAYTIRILAVVVVRVASGIVAKGGLRISRAIKTLAAMLSLVNVVFRSLLGSLL